MSARQRASEPPNASGASAPLSFEEAYGQLQQVIQELESGTMGLEASVRLFERGMALAEQCEQIVARAELRVTQLAAGAIDASEDGTA